MKYWNNCNIEFFSDNFSSLIFANRSFLFRTDRSTEKDYHEFARQPTFLTCRTKLRCFLVPLLFSSRNFFSIKIIAFSIFFFLKLSFLLIQTDWSTEEDYHGFARQPTLSACCTQFWGRWGFPSPPRKSLLYWNKCKSFLWQIFFFFFFFLFANRLKH